MSENGTRIDVYLDEDQEPYATFVPPERFVLDTTRLEDGRHVLRIVATDRSGYRGVRTIPFEVRNGPGIAVDGLHENDVVEGKINVLVNAYGGALEEKWEPVRAETPSPAPTWAWVVFIAIAAWAVYYGIQLWRPPVRFADTPTYGRAAQPAAGQSGADLYRTSCASCHQNNGQGVAKLFPPLAGNPVVTSRDPAEHARVVLFGEKGHAVGGVAYEAQMPAWADQLSDEEVAAVINHERTSWGNNAPTVTAAEVAAIRSRGASEQ